MVNQIKKYTIERNGIRLSALNIGCSIVEYSIDGKNIVVNYEDLDSYRINPSYLGAMVGRSAGRIPNAKIEGWILPLNYKEIHNHHGNDMHIQFFDVMQEEHKLTFTYLEDEGEYPGSATIIVIYELTENGFEMTVKANSDKPTLFNFTNHSYFNLGNDTVLNHNLKLDANKFTTLDEDMFCIADIDVDNTAFDFRENKIINDAMEQYDSQFNITKFIDHPFKLDGKVLYQSDELALEIESNLDYVVIYAGNYLGTDEYKFANRDNIDYAGICFEMQHRPGTTDLSTEYSSKTIYKLMRK